MRLRALFAIVIVWVIVVALLGSVIVMVAPAHAFDNGQYGDVDPKIKSWFESVRSPHGVPCCSISDGHRTTWRGTTTGGYEVPIDGEWVPVPPEAVVYNAGNPTDGAVVWYVRQGVGTIYVRCFVPGEGV